MQCNTRDEKRPGIPPVQYFRFRRAKDRAEVEALNECITAKELRKEARIAEKSVERGLDAFISSCRRRLQHPEWRRVHEHSERVRRFAYCIAESIQERGAEAGREADRDSLSIMGKIAGYHDIGKTLIAQYLVNREDGTWGGIGKGERIDFDKELPVLRQAHVGAGLRFLRLYKRLMSTFEYEYAKWIIGGHHLAYDGVGSASAPSYPALDRGIKQDSVPEAARIIRAADVYSAIMENRFYLSESEKVAARARGINAADAALGMLITVAGTDVDPLMVEHLIAGKYGVDPSVAKQVVRNLACRRSDWLRDKGADIKFSLDWVLPKECFMDVISHPGRRSEWDEPMGSMTMQQRAMAFGTS